MTKRFLAWLYGSTPTVAAADADIRYIQDETERQKMELRQLRLYDFPVVEGIKQAEQSDAAFQLRNDEPKTNSDIADELS